MEPTKMEYTVVSADDEVNAISACVEIIERHCSNELTTNNFDAGKVYNVVNYLYTRYRLEASD